MAKKIVDEILAAEAEGRALLEKAEISAREKINAAKLDAENIIEKAEKVNEQNMREAIAAANQRAKEEAENARAHTDTIEREYSTQAADRHDAAVSAVIDILAG